MRLFVRISAFTNRHLTSPYLRKRPQWCVAMNWHVVPTNDITSDAGTHRFDLFAPSESLTIRVIFVYTP